MRCYRHAAGSNLHPNWLCAFSRVIGSNHFKDRGTAFFEYVFSRKSKDYKSFKRSSWYKPTDVAVNSETVKPEGSSSSPGWIELLSVRWLLVCGSMPD